MRTAVFFGIAAVAALFVAGCGPDHAVPQARSQGSATTRPAADAVIHINGLPCPF